MCIYIYICLCVYIYIYISPCRRIPSKMQFGTSEASNKPFSFRSVSWQRAPWAPAAEELDGGDERESEREREGEREREKARERGECVQKDVGRHREIKNDRVTENAWKFVQANHGGFAR